MPTSLEQTSWKEFLQNKPVHHILYVVIERSKLSDVNLEESPDKVYGPPPRKKFPNSGNTSKCKGSAHNRSTGFSKNQKY